MATWLNMLVDSIVRFFSSLTGADWAAFGICFALLVALAVWLDSRRQRRIPKVLDSSFRRWIPRVLDSSFRCWLGETVLILAALFVTVGWATWYGPSSRSFLCEEVLVLTASLGGLVLLTRLRLTPLLFLVLSLTWTALWCYLSLRGYLFMMEQIGRDVADNPRSRALVPSVLIPLLLPNLLRLTLWAVVSFLGGIYFIRNGFAWWKFAVGSLLAGFLWAAFIIVPVHSGYLYPPPGLMTRSFYPWVQPIVWTAFGMLLLWLPGERRYLERLFEMPLRRTTEPLVKPRRSLLVSIVGNVCLLLLVACFMALFVLGFFERRQMRVAGYGLPGYHTPAERNAFPYLRTRFLKSSLKGGLPAAFNDSCFTANCCEPENILDADGWAKADLPKIRRALVDIQPYFDDFTSASLCDYYEEPSGSVPLGYLPVRETARALHTRAMLDIHDGNTSAALDAIAPLLGYYRQSNSSALLMHQMIGVAAAGIAGDALYNYYMALRRDPAAMEDLHRFLEQRRDLLNVQINADALRRGDLMDIMPNADIALPTFGGADRNTRTRALQFQQLRLAAALECYKARHGSYPVSLDNLVPEFMPILPLDPFDGKLHKYRLSGDDFSLTVDFKPYRNELPLKFPPPTADEVRAQKNPRNAPSRGRAKTSSGSQTTTGTAK